VEELQLPAGKVKKRANETRCEERKVEALNKGGVKRHVRTTED
jgi:hypothetical protein